MIPRLDVVDDDPGMVALLKEIGESIDFEVHTYLDGTDFKQRFDHDKIGILLLDLIMPECDGIEVLRFLAQQSFNNPIILISGYDTSVLNAAQKLAGEQELEIIDSFSKPLPITEIRTCLKQLRESFVRHTSTKNIPDKPGVKELHQALQNKEIILHYQPQIDIQTGSIVGVEGLARWQHPTQGLLYPDSFIGIAEDNGLIGELTRQVIEIGVNQAINWKNQGFTFNLSINVSADNIIDLSLPDQLIKLINANKLNPGLLTLEITESNLMGNLTTSLDILTRLRIKGFSLSIDDFGTGYSSLSQLHKIPFTELKIDRSFVTNLENDPEAVAIVETCIMLGKKLNMSVVAEGVETQNALYILKTMDCDIAQGYLIAKPMPAEDLSQWIQEKITTLSA
ncbi:MAG: EAL domain-containing response regulator [Gammaproteobacteria bacterium]|nr:EAL domain-containing response regulator [Gammaproteobacteria bacterium]